jgi:hypothetical protein
MWKKWYIFYVNPNIAGDKGKYLNRGGIRVEVKARTQDEADKRACRELATTGMLCKADLIAA